MKRYAVSIAMAVIAAIAMWAQQAPDFAYPAKVVRSADAAYAAVVKSGDDVKALRALVDYTVARDLVDNNNASEAATKIEAFAAEARSDAARGMAYTLLAELYNLMSVDNVHDTDSCRTASLDMIGKALSYTPALKATKLADYASLLVTDRYTSLYYPTLYDFVALRAIDIYSGYGFRYKAGVARLYDALIVFHRADTAPRLRYEIDRLQTSTRNSAELAAALKALFEANRTSEYSGDVLQALQGCIPPEQRPWLYDHCLDNIKKFPAYYACGCLSNIVHDLAAKSLMVTVPEIAIKGAEAEVKLRSINVNSATVTLYRVDNLPPTRDYVKQSELAHAAKIAETTVAIPGRVPFDADTVVRFVLPAYGRYVVRASFDGMQPANASAGYRIIDCTDLFMGTATYDKQQAFVVDPMTGRPVEGANINMYTHNKRDVATSVGSAMTDADGCATLSPDVSVIAVASRDGVLSAPRYVYPWHNYGDGSREVSSVRILTSLALYHPGDTVRWVAVAFDTSRAGSNVAAGKSLTVEMRDANYQKAGEVTVTTDAFGRAEGSFVIPRGNLTGYYTLRVGNEACTFMVSDYKLPTFEITDTKALRNIPGTGDVSLTGRVVTYSGFPVAEASVTVDVTVSQPWFRFGYRGSEQFYSATSITTAADGTFNVVLPSSLFAASPIPAGIYTATIAATSPAGETQQTMLTFTTADVSSIVVSDIGNLDVSRPVELPVKVLDNEGNPVAATLKYTLSSCLGEAAHGSIDTGNPVVDWHSVPGGTYTLKLSTPSDTVTVDNICIYRPGDKYSPSTRILWTPSQSVTLAAGERPELLLGTSAATTWVLVTCWDDELIIDRRWVTIPRGMRRLPIEAKSDRPYNVTLVAVNRLHQESVTVKMIPAASLRSISLEVSSMRDRMQPGNTETWRFKVTDRNGNPVASAIMLDMYNKALDRLASQSWSLAAPTLYGRRLYVDFSGISDTTSDAVYGVSRKPADCKYVATPSLNTYGYSLYQPLFRGRLYGFDRMAKLTSPMKAAANDGVVMVEESAMVTADAGAAVAEDETASVAGETAADTQSYRPSEIALALFRPMLTTDADGKLTFSFTAPNANTTWQLMALAFTPDMLVSQMSREILSSKPVMVQPVLPRFLRCGDSAELLASVMNNTDSLCRIATVVEVFDPSTGAILSTGSYTNHIPAGSSVTVGVNTGTIPASATLLGYRVRSTSGMFTDGEQAVIPVLSTVAPVMETSTFYSVPGEASVTVAVPPTAGTDDSLTLQYCDSPIWSVVSALPGLREQAPLTSVSAAESLFSAQIAADILRRNPEIAAGLHRMSADNAIDSALVSMLERNQSLKAVLLSATPWVLDAMSETERMERLALLFDKNEVSEAVSAALDVLAKTAASQGGWRWSLSSPASNEASEWATMRVLMLLGQLGRRDALPADNASLRRLTESAVKYIDDVMARRYARYPSGDYIAYTYMRTLFPAIAPSTAARRVSDATVQSIIGGWRRYSAESKAVAAIILERSGYHSTARSIISSLREYAIDTQAGGITWKSASQPYGSVYTTALVLEAFREVEPSAAEIDGIVRWLVLQKEALSWGASTATTAAVDAILAVASPIQRTPRPAHIYLGGDEIATGNAPFGGFMRISLPTGNDSPEQLRIVKGSTAGTAYGALYCRRSASMDTVAAARSEAVAITKQLMVWRDGDWQRATEISVGDRVRVDLIIDCERDLDYVTVVDDRPACLEPVGQLPVPLYSQGLCFYREDRDTDTRLFIDRLPVGVYHLSYETYATVSGRFTTGIATLQSQYAPQMSAHSSGGILMVDRR